MSQNWMRHFELQVLDNAGKGIDLGGFKVTFDIQWFNLSSQTRVGTFRIYNLAPETVQHIMGKEYSRVRAIVGYDGIAPDVTADQVGVARPVDPDKVGQSNGRNNGVIFDGEIRYSITGKENPVDSYVLIQATDSQQAYSTSITHETLAAGYTVADTQKALMRTFAVNGAEQGNLPAMPPTVFPRGRTMLGMTRDYMDNVAQQCTATWMFVDGKMEMVADNEVVHEAIELNGDTGLIGRPQQTIDNGLNARILINPNVRVNGLVWLNQRINQAVLPAGDTRLSPGQTAAQHTDAKRNIDLPESQAMPPGSATDGVYKVVSIVYTGDTQGLDWYMDLICEAYDAQYLLSQ